MIWSLLAGIWGLLRRTWIAEQPKTTGHHKVDPPDGSCTHLAEIKYRIQSLRNSTLGDVHQTMESHFFGYLDFQKSPK